MNERSWIGKYLNPLLKDKKPCPKAEYLLNWADYAQWIYEASQSEIESHDMDRVIKEWICSDMNER